MCTVTYIPTSKKSFFITSNRDERKVRLKAETPRWYRFASGQLLFPKDGNAGGTWMALHENRNAMVLLNGAFVNHHYHPPYRKSRGLIFLDVFDHPQPVTAFELINLHKIEPFTLVIRQGEQLFETRWDGQEKSIAELDAGASCIWSSVTLYDKDVIEKRKNWFELFQKEYKESGSKEILHFHRFAGDGDEQNDVLMNRNNEMFTVSITQLQRQNELSYMHYHDLLNGENFTQAFNHSISSLHASV
ncbi:MAG: NRDE family protein [Chitinophagaceae bacterium]|nr:NRDE family protein [Chitinophagaceae bacterium]